ncbi:MAG: histidinol-phosphatase [Paramuribaculum sp.]|nr:histidinol-phosphatase [Paramuribaculum sp.]
MDFSAITQATELYNFHSHTQFCDGKATMEEFAEAAAKCGMTHYGFSPHSPVPIESPCNMKREDVPAFLDEVRRLNTLYEGRTRFYAAMEVDYLDDSWGPSNLYFASLGLDYIIGSVHFIPNDSGFVDIDGRFESFRDKMSRYFANDIRHVVKTFYSQSHAMLAAGGLDILGHFDKVGQNASYFRPGIEDEYWYKCEVHDLIDDIIARGQRIELNTKAFAEHGRFFPGVRYIPELLSHDIEIIVNSDAHRPALINASRPQALAAISEYGTHKSEK